MSERTHPTDPAQFLGEPSQAHIYGDKSQDLFNRGAVIAAVQRALAAREQADKQIDSLRGLDTASRVRFYEHDFYVLSNFSAFTLQWRGCRFDTSEAAYHYEKFPDRHDIGAEILHAPSAHEAFKIAERNKVHRRLDWDKVKVGIMLDILRTKAAQHEYVRRKLLATGDRELVEDSWRDNFWGWGPNRDGKNMLGKLWMQVRSELREAAPQQAAPADTRFAWLLELFLPDGGNSLGLYHTGFTTLHGTSRSTKDPLQAKRYATKEQAEATARGLESLRGVWHAVEHGFGLPAAPAGQAAAPELPDPLGCRACVHPQCGRFDGPRQVECNAMLDNACARPDDTRQTPSAD